MYPSARKAVDVYAQVGVETGVAAADPHKLILMLFDGTHAALVAARHAMTAREPVTELERDRLPAMGRVPEKLRAPHRQGDEAAVRRSVRRVDPGPGRIDCAAARDVRASGASRVAPAPVTQKTEPKTSTARHMRAALRPHMDSGYGFIGCRSSD